MTAEVSPRKGTMPVAHFVEDGAERKEVAAGVEFFALGLLGRHVGDGADGGAGTGEIFEADGGCGLGLSRPAPQDRRREP